MLRVWCCIQGGLHLLHKGYMWCIDMGGYIYCILRVMVVTCGAQLGALHLLHYWGGGGGATHAA